jgi:lipid-binding SYLF domain-containing protein
MISVVEIGFIFSGNVGTGILLKKQPKPDGTTGTYSQWSAPSAVGLTGLRYGILIGASVKALIIFILDEPTLDAITTNHGFKLWTQNEITLGPLGRTYKFDVELLKGGIGSTVSIAFSQGAFLGFNVNGAVLGAQDKVNAKFFQPPNIKVNDILNVACAEILKKVNGKVLLLEQDQKKTNAD